MNPFRLLFSVLIVVVGSVVALFEPKDWPDSFSVSFVSNITLQEGVGTPVGGYMYYDWTNGNVQRVDHEAGAVECVEFYGTTGPCKLFFTPKGLYRTLQAPMPEGLPECCLDLADIHASPPDWASTGNPTFAGVVNDPYTGGQTLKWMYDNLPVTGRRLGDKEPHLYYETVAKREMGRLPLIFTFPGKDGIQDYHFDTSSLKIEPQDPSLFELPLNCDRPCAT